MTKPKSDKGGGTMKTVQRVDAHSKHVPKAPDEGVEVVAASIVPKEEQAGSDLAPYYREVCAIVDSAEMTATGGWAEFWRMMRGIEKKAREGLVTAEKMNEVLRMQAAIQFVEHNVEWLSERVDSVNGWAKRAPLFADSYCYEAKVSEEDGVLRVTVVNTKSGEIMTGKSALPSEVVAAAVKE